MKAKYGIERKKKRITGRERQWIFMCILPVLHVFVYSYLTLYGLLIPFKDYKFGRGIWGSDWVGLDNILVFLRSNDAIRLTRNTLFLNVILISTSMIAQIALAIIFYLLTSRRGLKVYQTVMITPHFLSWVVGGYVAYAILAQNGVINTLLKNIGMQPISFYTQGSYWPAILSVANVWKGVGMGCIIYYATLMGVDSSLYEAARIDGAKRRQEIRYIMLPMLSRVIVLNLIMAIGGILSSDFGLFYNMTRDSGSLYATTDVIDTYVYRAMRVMGDMELSSAVNLLKSVIGFVLVYITNWLVRRYDEELSLF